MDNPETSGPSGDNSLKPGYASSLVHAAKQFKASWASLLLVAIIYFVILEGWQVISYIRGFFDESYWQITPASNQLPENFAQLFLFSMIFSIIFGLIAMILTYGYIHASIKAARGEKPSVIDLFRPVKRFFSVLFSAILLYMIIGFSAFFFFIPAIFFICRFIFTPFLIVDQKAGVFQAIEGSWDMTRGHFWKIFLLGLTIWLLMCMFMVTVILVSIPMFFSITPDNFSIVASRMWIPTLVLGIISIPVSMYSMLIFSSLYHALRLEKGGGSMPNSGTVVSNPNIPSTI